MQTVSAVSEMIVKRIVEKYNAITKREEKKAEVKRVAEMISDSSVGNVGVEWDYDRKVAYADMSITDRKLKEDLEAILGVDDVWVEVWPANVQPGNIVSEVFSEYSDEVYLTAFPDGEQIYHIKIGEVDGYKVYLVAYERSKARDGEDP